MGDRAGEREALERSAKLDPRLALTQNQLGMLDIADNKPAQAAERFKAALSIDPEYAEAQTTWEVVWPARRSGREAEPFRQGGENNPWYAQAFVNLGLILAGQGKFSDAAKEMETAVQISPSDPAAPSALGMVEAKLGRPDDAIGSFRKVVALTPDSPEAHLNLGIALADHMNLPGALR
jgi:tetratricopeptide (TPR) repeat protein